MSAADSSLLARAKEVFADALELPEADRAALVDQACAGDTDLRALVEGLLASHASAARFMHAPSVSLVESPLLRLTERAGAVIGRYKLLQLIGEGGFGSVFLAEQREPVVRQVALKVIKLGMDTRQVIARFEAERQALAMMDHPNIARVFDAGATDMGRPYFVMELVRGQPITQYCDNGNLGVRERLELFEQVCHAVQHAHQKGIIHRDIKPRNVLVTVTDGRAIPKVIDFGVAKATSARLAEKSFFTEHRTLIGTPEYMSPEQAEMRSGDVDTRSDIYSLGVLLYELLTGTTPFEAGTLRDAAFGEIQRIIREVDPPRPSTRLSTMKDALPSVAAHRQVEPARLPGLVKGDLDWIVMKCLEKDRARRYETANGLALEVRRHLSGEPVLAAPPGRGYRARKFVRRHRLGVLAGATIGAALVVGLVGASIGFVRARAERDRAERIADFMEDVLRGAGATLAPGRDSATMRDMVDGAAERIRLGELKDSPEAELRLRLALGGIYRVTGDYKGAGAMLDPAIALARSLASGAGSSQLAEALIARGELLRVAGRVGEAEPLLAEALEVYRRIIPGDDLRLAHAMEVLAYARELLNRDPESEPLRDQAYQMRLRLKLGPAHLCWPACDLAFVRLRLRRGETVTLLEQALEMAEGPVKADRRQMGNLLGALGEAYEQAGRYADAERVYRRSYETRRRLYEGDHLQVAVILACLGHAIGGSGRPEEAEAMFGQALEMSARLWPRGDQYFAYRVLVPWADFLRTQNRTDEGRAVAAKAVAMVAHLPAENYQRRAVDAMAAQLGVLPPPPDAAKAPGTP